MKRLGVPKVGSGGVGTPTHIVALAVSVQVCNDICRGFLFVYFYLLQVAGEKISLLYF
jgi:hypothetical protein